jgi:hypothetical protein
MRASHDGGEGGFELLSTGDEPIAILLESENGENVQDAPYRVRL